MFLLSNIKKKTSKVRSWFWFHALAKLSIHMNTYAGHDLDCRISFVPFYMGIICDFLQPLIWLAFCSSCSLTCLRHHLSAHRLLTRWRRTMAWPRFVFFLTSERIDFITFWNDDIAMCFSVLLWLADVSQHCRSRRAYV